MKIKPHFYSENNKLYSLNGKEVNIQDFLRLDGAKCTNASVGESNSFYFVEVRWTLIGTDVSSPYERFLSELRDCLKAFEGKNSFAVILPVLDKASLNGEDSKGCVECFCHCARRIKDCANVIGFSIPEGVDPLFFRERLKARHEQYIFFSDDISLLSRDSTIVGIRIPAWKSAFVLYNV